MVSFCGKALCEKHHDGDQYDGDDKDPEHSETHDSQRFKKCTHFQPPYQDLQLNERNQTQDQTARDNGRDLAGDIDAGGLYDQNIGGILLDAHLCDDSG